jgi:hypothetical protein
MHPHLGVASELNQLGPEKSIGLAQGRKLRVRFYKQPTNQPTNQTNKQTNKIY